MKLDYWEEKASVYLGDIIAHRLFRGLRFLDKRMQRSKRLIVQNTSNYLQEETQQLPSRLKVKDFFTDIADMQEPVTQLENRVQALQKHLDNLKP